ncbi:MAG: class I SAM-dependent methyltransferase [Candidatus Hydrogenedentes bacterium]|nr:class I SAM-dependent methyltransferase [Candidatus Hydrogenedentota bacterium]
MVQETGRLAASFRDPSGFVFRDDQGVLLRQVNAVYGPHYDQLMDSGLYAKLVKRGLLVSHEEISLERALTSEAVRVLAPEPIKFISYPYEWCAGQLRDAALLTLDIQSIAMEHGLSLKDASAFNVQFQGARAVFIDTLSFEPYVEGKPWIAYGQFCRHFLAPLALMHYGEAGMARLMRGYIDGIPLPLAARALPWRSKLKPGLLLHLHLLARAERAQLNQEGPGGAAKAVKVSRQGLLGIIDNLRSTIRGLDRKSDKTTWGDYYAHTNYSDAGARAKEALVRDYLGQIAPETVWDLGANTGVYSALAAECGAVTVAMDLDYGAVEALYLREKASLRGVLPLVMDLSNPSPALGWAHEERASLLQRGPADCAMALALIHHLCIGNNVPLPQAAAFFARTCRHLIIEFVPKEDSMVNRMLATREDVFPGYTREGFEAAFGAYFVIEAQSPVDDTLRTLYRMKNRTQP